MNHNPLISVVVPVYNGGHFLARCLSAINASSFKSYELIVVDDCSTDDSAKMSAAMGARVLSMKTQSGPASARNYGSLQARGEILFFVDADVVVQPDTLGRVADDLGQHTDVAAIFGSYDDSPAEKNFVSQYKNLYHHFIHQNSRTEAATFWAGCGAIRRDVFVEVGGFDDTAYSRPSIEDIELGLRLKKSGHRILLDKQLQVKHLKEWRLSSLLRTDIFSRAVPWSNLIIKNHQKVDDLNLQGSHKLSAACVGLGLLILPLAAFRPYLVLPTILLLLVTIIGLNSRLYRFFLDRRGFTFVSRAIPLHLLYYFYSGVTFVLCSAYGRVSRVHLMEAPLIKRV